MPDFQKMDRTWLCSVLFLDIVNYSSQPVDTQMKWKARFNGYLGEAIRNVPESERVILDTGDGAAVCFLGAPEVAMFAALELLQCFVRDEAAQQSGFRARTGVNLGPVKLVKDLNGRLNAIGEGINSGQRVMSFAPENQILVSQSYFEVVSCLSDDYKALFKLKGIETDKHVREHTVYSLLPPASGTWPTQAAGAGQERPAEPPPSAVLPTAAAPLPPLPVASATEQRPQKRSPLPLLVAGILVILVAAGLTWRFAGSGGAKASSQESSAPTASPPNASTPGNTPAGDVPAAQGPAQDQAGQAPPGQAAPAPSNAPGSAPSNAPGNAPGGDVPAAQRRPAPPAASPPGQAAQGEASRGQTAQGQAAPPAAPPATPVPSNAPGQDVPAPQGRPAPPAPSIQSQAPRSSDPALDGLNQAIQANPNDAQSYASRAAIYQQRRQFDRAIQDYDQVIRLQPSDAQAYAGRANAKQMAGDGRGAAADRLQAFKLQRR